ncbi:MAG TPA: phosphatidate cytidylyltransferase [Candidatus Atribacteria bacterium]|nr:phosphatidate cytidylyltransferase [Candidatus Atribacteria bacterium]
MKATTQSSDLKKRAWSVIWALPVFLFLILFSPQTLILVFFFLSLGSLREYGQLVYERGEWTPWLWFSLASLVLLYLSLINIDYKIILFSGYILFLVLIGWGLKKPEQIVEQVAFYLLGFLYCSLLPFFWVKMGIAYDRGSIILFALPVWTNDIFAYLVGRKWGKHKIVPRISPGKSWEGLAGGIGMATLTGLILVTPPVSFSLFQGLLAGFSIALVSFLGDIWESVLKRRAGVKNSGNFLPGHGGILDRFDSFFLVGPLVYLLRLSWGG